MARSIMIQGTGSNVGKSLLVAGLARALTRRGLCVRPFKPQNMSNNAAVTADGGEIGRAQALQARACGVAPHTDMNPVLLKPQTETGAQVVLCGQRIATVRAAEYAAFKPRLLPPALDAFHRLSAQADITLVEGAGSPAEINLRAGDIANMGFAEAADIPVILAGDIDRGGVIAQIVGTRAVLPAADAARIKGFLVNRFRGDPALFSDGMTAIETLTGWPSLGLIPWFDAAHKLPAEDAQDIRSGPAIGNTTRVTIAVPRLSRIANFDDLDPLAAEPAVDLQIIPPGQPLPGNAALVIIPGSKSTIGDLAFFREQGWDIDLAGHIRRGGQVLGICGGYQMLGRQIDDPKGIEGPPGGARGLGHLNVTTLMTPQKTLTRTSGTSLGAPIEGYEIHIGATTGPDTARAWATNTRKTPISAASPSGQIRGLYMHGLFSSDDFRAAFLAQLGGSASGLSYETSIDETLNALADHLEAHLDIAKFLQIAERDTAQ